MTSNLKSTGLEKDWLYNLEGDKFALYINSAKNINHNFYEACMYRAKEIYDNTDNPVLGFSGGLDSQLVLHCLYSQGLKVDCIFRYYKGYNDIELNNLSIIEKKYGFKTKIIEIDPDAEKNNIIKEYQRTLIPPNQLLYKKFIEQLPDDLDILQGLEGPDIIKNKDTIYYLESYESYEFTRKRAINLLNRKGKFISFEKNSNILLSILKEDIYQSFMHTYEYFSAHNVKIINYWDDYIKVYLYHKYWKNELVYFPKYQGTEGISWIINGPKNNYNNRMILISISKLLQILISQDNNYCKFLEYSNSK